MATKKAKKKAAKKVAKKATLAKKRVAAARPAAKAKGRAGARKAPKKTPKKATATRATKAAKARAAKPAKKAAARPAAKKASRGAPRAKPIRRRDHAGHIDPQYAQELIAKSGGKEADPQSFVERPRASDDLVEELAEEFVAEATSAEHEGEDVLDQDVPEERGGPFVETTADQEFAHGTDPSNPKGAKREPFPTT